MAKEETAHDLDELVQHSLGKEGLRVIVDWVARFSYWVSPQVYREVQVVYPKTRRRHPGETDRSMIDGVGVWGNQPASSAFWKAFGETPAPHTPSNYRNFVLCHLYEGSAHNPEHFTNLANLTVLPRCLESFSEWSPVREVLKWHSYQIYGYSGPREVVPAQPEYYPALWPGVRKLDPNAVERIGLYLKARREGKPAYYSRAGPLEARIS